MIIGKNSGKVSIDLNSLWPVLRAPRALLVLLITECGIRPRQWWRRFAQVVLHVAAIVERIQRRNYRAPIGPFPETDIERNADRSFLRRVGPTDMWRRLPG